MPLHYPTGYDDLPTTAAAATDALESKAGRDSYADAPVWLDRVEALIERYPWPALFLALCIGYALSRKMR
jgi:hypothetical protein